MSAIVVRNCLFLPLACLLLASHAIGADADPSEIERLLQKRRYEQALSLVQSHLQQQPQDPQWRLTHGVILVEMGRLEDARRIFEELIDDYPQIPEPYNNLAVVLAREGKIDEARATLEKAIKTNPSYATAYENLGDLYARLASESYAKSLGLDARNRALQPKVQLISQLVNLSSLQAPPTTSSAETPRVAAAPPTDSASPATPIPSEIPQREAILQAVEQWRSAWSARNIEGYIASYVADFVPDGFGGDHDAWVAQRRARILGKSRIDLQLSDIGIQPVDQQRVRVTFIQRYDTPGFSSTTRKTLELVERDGQWKISAERVR